MSEEKKVLDEFTVLEKQLSREQKLVLIGMMKGLQINSIFQTQELQIASS